LIERFVDVLAVATWFLNFSNIALPIINPTLGSPFVPNLVQICQETADKLWWEGKDENINRKNYIGYEAV
jgi:hypothetical protein